MNGIRLLLCGLLAAASCGGAAAAPSTPSPALASFSSTHFTFRYSEIDAATVAQTAAAVEAHYDRVLADLGATAMPRVTVTLYTDHAALVAGAGPSAGVIPSWASGLATAVDQIHLMSPNLASWGLYDRAVINLVHEFAHCASMQVNRTIPNNPRWLWEAVAIYEARQFVDPRTLSYMVARQPPAFDRLNSLDNGFVYEVGYLVAEFVVDQWGLERLRALVTTNGDTERVLGLSRTEFEARWYAAVRDKYPM